MKRQLYLNYIDFMLIYAIMELINLTQIAPSKAAIIGCIDRQIELFQLGEERVRPITSNWTFQNHINKLRYLGILTPMGKYKLTPFGEEIWEKCAAGVPVNYPVSVEAEPGSVNWESAIYYKEGFHV